MTTFAAGSEHWRHLRTSNLIESPFATVRLWRERDVEAEVWTKPATRMEPKREQRVPLGRRALEVVARPGPSARAASGCPPGRRAGRSRTWP